MTKLISPNVIMDLNNNILKKIFFCFVLFSLKTLKTLTIGQMVFKIKVLV